MPWARTDVGEQRVKFVIRAASGKERMAALCREFGISRPTGYRWRRRFQQAGSVTAVVERSRRPKHSPWQTAPRKEERVVELRREHGWGAKKLDVLLREEDTHADRHDHQPHLEAARTGGEKDSHRAGAGTLRARGAERAVADGRQRRVSRERWDVLSAVDSRRSQPLRGGTVFVAGVPAELVHPCLVNAFERYGVPEAMLMDHGSVWWGTTNGYGLTWLSVRLIEQGIRLSTGACVIRRRRGKWNASIAPWTEAIRHRGKPQQMAEWPGALEEFRQIYNERRPHEALGMKRPLERYRASERAYQAAPREWEYPEGSIVRRLNPVGLFILGGADVVRVRGAGGTMGAGGECGKSAGSELPAHVRAGDRPAARAHAGAGDVARCWQGSPVALRAPYEPCQHRKPGVRSVTDVLTHGVTHVL